VGWNQDDAVMHENKVRSRSFSEGGGVGVMPRGDPASLPATLGQSA
jgi:hypothetical protein